MSGFNLHPNLSTKIVICELPLCLVLLEDHADYPWLFLVPRLPDLKKLLDLAPVDQHKLMHELTFTQQVIEELFNPDQINVAAIGNKTPQLHIHVIGRYQTDPAWPSTVWDQPNTLSYTLEKKDETVLRFKKAFALYVP